MQLCEFLELTIDNKYRKWYFDIIENAEKRIGINDYYTEKHHIIPTSIDNVKRKDGKIVILTAREHFICHILLPKFLTSKNKSKMINALLAMSYKKERRYFNSRLYEFYKKDISNIISEQMKLLWKNEDYREKGIQHLKSIRKPTDGKNNPMYGKTGEKSPHFNKPKSKEHKNKIKNALLGMRYTKERRENMSKNCPKNSLGKKWYHNPNTKEEKYFIENNQPDNFVRGRLPK